MSDPVRTRSYPWDESTADQPPPGGDHPAQFGRYRVVRLLGEGTFGRAYLAHDDQLNRPVAIKVPHRHRVRQPQDVEAYLAEARVLAGLDHPGIVPVHDVGCTADGLPFVVTKLIEGSDLATTLKGKRLTFAEAADLVMTVALAVHHAHRQGLVHRDIKPSNILLDTTGRPYVADFGLALREEDFGRGCTFAGTPAYMSPEQARDEGHRVDGRSDVFSLGVILYELLTGRRPFRGESQAELLDRIIHVEVRPPRQVDDAIPKELERICLKALSKRAAERYTTAKDLAEDLRHFLAGAPDGAEKTPVGSRAGDEPRAVAAPASDPRPLKIVPKGLRSFDAADADFFLELLPGPRDRDGLPDPIRFWKSRIEEHDAADTFPVGLIYGPSGCGKSSLVKAGLLPRLAGHVVVVYVEAAAEGTEVRLLKGLRRHCPDVPGEPGLVEALAGLRQGRFLAPRRKVLIVLDQFEQWLHASRGEKNTELVRALRHCDGARVQCLVLVRDDFWMATTRFTADLEVDLVQGRNSAAVDLFDPLHARKVLGEFGRAYGRLPDHPRPPTGEQEAFLEQVVAGLAREGRIIPVRLALFAEMVKGKPWTPASLKTVGGMEGVGVTFLEETFAAAVAPPSHRLHTKAAQAVLKALLPETGTDIKGNMRSDRELLAASGYAARPRDFDTLVRILDGELRLITPTDPEGGGERRAAAAPAGDRFYQLTHDYLVPSLREWLTRKQRETRRGRAELRLAERAAAWAAKPESRQLPAGWEWLTIRLLTRRRDWTPSQARMMQKAGRVHLTRGLILAIMLALIGWGGYEGFGRLKAHALQDRLLDASTADVPDIVADTAPYRRWLNPLLRDSYAAAAAGKDPRKQLHSSLALLPSDPGQREYLYARLLEAHPHEVPVLRDALEPYKEALTGNLWTAVEQPPRGKEHQRLRAACALATYDPDSPRWEAVLMPVAADLVTVPAVYLERWVDLCRPIRARLLAPLAAVFRDTNWRETERSLATDILADYASDRPPVLADLLMDAEEKQFTVILPKVQSHAPERVIPHFQGCLARGADPAATEGEKERLGKRRANAGLALMILGEPAGTWALLGHTPDPRARSYLIHRLRWWPASAGTVFHRLNEEKQVSVRRALLLSLGEYGKEEVSAAANDGALANFLDLYRNDPDPGTHGAVAWLLRQWKQDARLEAVDKELATGRVEGQRGWYVTRQGQTMVVIPGPVEFLMGSPPGVQDRKDLETRHRRRIDRSFALAANKVTKEQFLRFDPTFTHGHMWVTPDPDCPVVAVSWYQAAAYCNWLSEREGLPEAEWCYLPNDKGKYAEGMRLAPDHLRRTGYRLPTEAEWEYACRAGAATGRYYGQSAELLPKYAWFTNNSQPRTGRVGTLKPNDLGLFDMHGNLYDWCRDKYGDYPVAAAGEPVGDGEADAAVLNDDKRVLRGGAYGSPAPLVRSAYRTGNQPLAQLNVFGFRPARTIR